MHPENQIQKVQILHQGDLAAGRGEVYLPYALEHKYPNAARELGWQYLFPSRDLFTDPLSGVVRRHHVDPTVINRAIKVAVRRAGLTKAVIAQSFRHSFAAHLLQRGTEWIILRPANARKCLTKQCPTVRGQNRVVPPHSP